MSTKQMTVEQASAVLDNCQEWIGWDRWEWYAPDQHKESSDILLDGKFNVNELKALVVLMERDIENSKIATGRQKIDMWRIQAKASDQTYSPPTGFTAWGS